ncbi:MAG TPA: ATP synthase F0 subunit B [Firmicutes bacterium]|uniref:ATP synthase subunit b n=1 Tax=Candidatus Coatesbacteria bacterium 4484_99 TaxID=1970774 RepID=A0A1W9S0A2_9BACT|nr:MAG: ATP synthase F0 subunit B [Candidatus Coatesbacteria bacterium 4484_99]RLC40703.1 MAG: ATP synthase F0 subunit B [Candidatus Coatesbacteria bacterium]RLC42142.1 MAG: ATP synthase F0 subunit B [Candidatus Coatesbacteria bacterium]RLC43841.1 MAG: ATP synthase F0 subunit B [Candidatus Coatesbacteria bacterium]HDM43336.1 ATP synthase F0 subunit B [Bacillota bacterium]
MIEIHPVLLIYQIVVFLIFVYLMYRFVYNPVIRMIDERRRKVEMEVEDAEKKIKDAETLKGQYEKKISEIHKEIEQMKKDAEFKANEIRNKIISDAQEEANRIIEYTKRRTEEERKRLMEDVRNYAVDLSIIVARKILEEKIDKKSDRRLAERFLDEMSGMQFKE